MPSRITRRRVLLVAGAACALPKLAVAAPVARWQGNALGAHAEIRLAGLTYAEAAPTFAGIERELDRLEGLFSLYRDDSALVRLNRAGRLETPPPEMLELLGLSQSIHDRTGGLFDPSVQPLFELHARSAVQGRAPARDEIDVAQARVGFGGVEISSDEIRFDRPGMALTLNGIAQGFITDRIATLLRSAGLTNVLVDIGEIRALGPSLAGKGWTVRLSDGARLALSDRAIASSNRCGTMVNAAAGIGHIFDPRGTDIRSPTASPTVNAIHVSAAIADGYATAAALVTADVVQSWREPELKFIWS